MDCFVLRRYPFEDTVSKILSPIVYSGGGSVQIRRKIFSFSVNWLVDNFLETVN